MVGSVFEASGFFVVALLLSYVLEICGVNSNISNCFMMRNFIKMTVYLHKLLIMMLWAAAHYEGPNEVLLNQPQKGQIYLEFC